MSSGGDNESEILLGNKQLLAIFFVIAFLLFVAFTGGYFVGRGSPERKPLVAESTAPTLLPKGNDLETHPVGPAGASLDDGVSDARLDGRPAPKRITQTITPDEPEQTVLGSSKPKSKSRTVARQQPEPVAQTTNVPESYAPKTGQTFLQVVVLARDDAYGVAEVLSKKGFRAHSVPKPGGGKQYRVLVGPIRDTSELSATRDALRKTGFVDVFLQHY